MERNVNLTIDLDELWNILPKPERLRLIKFIKQKEEKWLKVIQIDEHGIAKEVRA